MQQRRCSEGVANLHFQQFPISHHAVPAELRDPKGKECSGILAHDAKKELLPPDLIVPLQSSFLCKKIESLTFRSRRYSIILVGVGAHLECTWERDATGRSTSTNPLSELSMWAAAS